jgi:hypothetical protein
MPLFGSKPKKVYVLIYYRTNPPTISQQADIMSTLSKSGTPAVLAEVGQLSAEVQHAPAPMLEAYMKLQCTQYLMRNGIGIASKKLDYKTKEMSGFVVTTMAGEFVGGPS